MSTTINPAYHRSTVRVVPAAFTISYTEAVKWREDRVKAEMDFSRISYSDACLRVDNTKDAKRMFY
jgi:hypothetical protein